MSTQIVDEKTYQATGNYKGTGRFDFGNFVRRFGLNVAPAVVPDINPEKDRDTATEQANRLLGRSTNPHSITQSNQIIPAFLQCSDRWELLAMTVGAGVFGLLAYSFFAQRDFLP